MLGAPEHQEMNRPVEVIWRVLCTITISLMVHARFSEAYIDIELMSTTDNIFMVLPIKYMLK